MMSSNTTILSTIRELISVFTILSMAATIVISPLSSNIAEAAGTQAKEVNYEFPVFGTATLDNPDYYETASTLLSPSDVFTPSKTQNFDNPIYAFYLNAKTHNSLLDVQFRIKSDDKYSELYAVGFEDTYFGDKAIEQDKLLTSDLYAFTKKVDSIEFFYDGEKDFDVLVVDNSKDVNTSIKTQEAASSAAEKEYSKMLFAGLGLNLITREEWGAPLTSGWGPTIADVNRIVVHHTATSVDTSNPKNTVKAIYDYHKNRCSNNIGTAPGNCSYSATWQDIGYNYLIDPAGNVYEGRAGGNGVIGAHAIPNAGSIGISILGNYSSQAPTQASLETLTKLIAYLSELNNFSIAFKNGVYGHRDVSATACPGQTFYDKLPSITNTANSLKGKNYAVAYASGRSRDLLQQREVVKSEGNIEIIVDTSYTSALLKEKLLTLSRGVTEIKKIGNKLIYKIPEEKADQLIAETLLVSNSIKIQPNYVYKTTSWDNSSGTRSVPSDYNTSTHWGLEKTKTPEAWKLMGGCTSDNTCGGSSSVQVAVLDTGVAYEDFNYDAGSTFSTYEFSGLYIEVPDNSTQDGEYNEGYDRVYKQSPELTNVTFVNPYDSAQDYLCDMRALDANTDRHCNANELAKINHANDDYGHGTFVTSIIAANTSDNSPNKVVGIAHNIQIMPIKVFLPNDKSMCQDSSGNPDTTCASSLYDYRVTGNSFTISQGIDYAVANGADIINLSLRGSGTDPMIESSVNAANSAGIVVVAAAGNDNSDIANYFPASYPNVISVGASTETDARASYSNYGEELDMVAPVGDLGSGVPSLTLGCYPSKNNCSDESNANILQTFSSSTSPLITSGTSFAAPQVTAAAALIKSQKSSITPTEMYNLLVGTTTKIGGNFNNNTGFGLLNIENALNHINNIPEPPVLSYKQYFTWYDTSKADRLAWILVGNPSSTESASVNIKIGNSINQNYTIGPNSRITPMYNNVKDGPVIITSSIDVFSTQRVMYEGSFNEYSAVSGSALDTKYYFPWYDASTAARKAWILIANPSSSQYATVNVKIGNRVNQSYYIAPGNRVTPEFNGIKDGPVIITSDIEVFATERAQYEGSFNEVAAIPQDSLTTKYYFTWFDTSKSDRLAWILVGNPSSTQTASVNIKIGNQINANFSVPPNGRITPSYDRILNGPVTITSNIPVFASQRVQYEGSFNEYMGISEPSLSNKYYFTWFDTSRTTRKSWILIGNPSSTQTANISIRIGGQINTYYQIPPNGKITPSYNRIQNGPVVITSDINVYTTQRSDYEGSFNEYPGIVK